MKNLLIVLLIVLVAGCHGKKKVTESRVVADKTTEVKETTAAQLIESIDTTKLSDTETTYRKIEYYPPASNPSPPFDTLRYSGSGSGTTGQIKSVETLTVKKRSEAKGKTEAVKSEETAINSLISESTDTKTETEEKPAPDPKRWMWIFGILALITGLIVYLRNSPVLRSVTELVEVVLSVVRKFLKI